MAFMPSVVPYLSSSSGDRPKQMSMFFKVGATGEVETGGIGTSPSWEGGSAMA
jgi:hypothetical protein